MTSRVSIIGGGFSGVMTAINLLRLNTLAEISIIEPAEVLGRGLAYGTTHCEDLLNVVAGRMSALPDEPDHFFDYACTIHKKAVRSDFLPRMTYGKYLHWLIDKQASVKHIKSAAIDIEKTEHDYIITLATKDQIRADFVVLAVGNLSGKRPGWLDKVDFQSKRYLHNPWNIPAINSIASNEDVLLVGSALTAIDKIMELTSNGHKGHIFVISRHGIFPQVHVNPPLPARDMSAIESMSLLKALAAIKREVRKSDDWRPIFDGLRPITQNVWRSLSTKEQRAFICHLQTYWDMHRHRMPPATAVKIAALQKSGQVKLLAGRILAMKEVETGIVTTVKPRGCDKPEAVSVGTVINCTGPQSGFENIDCPLLMNLLARGLISSHRSGAGIKCEPSGQTIDSDKKLSNRMFAIGRLLKAELMESVAVPELRLQAKNLAELISDHLNNSSN